MSACVITATSPPQSPPPAGGEATCLRRRKPLLFGDIAVMLDAGGTQPRHADAVEHALPCRQFLGTHAISLTRLAGREQAAIDGGDHLRLPPAHPPRRIGPRQLVQSSAERRVGKEGVSTCNT